MHTCMYVTGCNENVQLDLVCHQCVAQTAAQTGLVHGMQLSLSLLDTKILLFLREDKGK